MTFSVAYAMGLVLDAFLFVGDVGEDEPCEPGDLTGDVAFLVGTGTGIGRTIVTGLTVPEDWEPWSTECRCV